VYDICKFSLEEYKHKLSFRVKQDFIMNRYGYDLNSFGHSFRFTSPIQNILNSSHLKHAVTHELLMKGLFRLTLSVNLKLCVYRDNSGAFTRI
jgi:hypothetical protein